MIIPGWGQFYNNKPAKGGVLLGIELLSAGSAVMHYLLYRQSQNAYERAESASSPPLSRPTQVRPSPTGLSPSE